MRYVHDLIEQCGLSYAEAILESAPPASPASPPALDARAEFMAAVSVTAQAAGVSFAEALVDMPARRIGPTTAPQRRTMRERYTACAPGCSVDPDGRCRRCGSLPADRRAYYLRDPQLAAEARFVRVNARRGGA